MYYESFFEHLINELKYTKEEATYIIQGLFD